MRFRDVMLLVTLVLSPATALGQSAQKPIQIYVPFAPGGSADGIARILSNEIGASLGRQVVVINQPGASGTMALVTAARQPGDGDTLAVAATAALVINPHIPSSNSFDTLKELTPVAKLIDIPIVMVSSPKGDLKTIKAVIERAKSAPGGVTYGTTGANSAQHMAVELLKKMTGANFVHVPYRGSAPAVTDVLGGQIPMASVDLTSAHQHVKAGTLNALGVTSAERAKTAPEIPTIAEGGVPGFNGSAGFIGVLAPATTPAAKVRELSQMVAAIMAKPDVQAKVAQLSVEPAYENEARWSAMLQADSNKWKELLKTLPQQN
ncbi:MAG: tripartite tricarboxylate transporter substrate binding protein [Xanthobacteraceae bacterium]|nr:tripartite tricarboxylate transporter substrate binding protein [Xanthobacteraceae bacterium]